MRELGKGTRLETSLEIIAAIIGTFDLVSIVELEDAAQPHRVKFRKLAH